MPLTDRLQIAPLDQLGVPELVEGQIADSKLRRCSSVVRDHDEGAVKADLVLTHCRRSWRLAPPPDGRLDSVAAASSLSNPPRPQASARES